jgi:hypothetical protein
MKRHTGDYLIHAEDRTIYVYTEALASMKVMREPTEAELAEWFKEAEPEAADNQDLLGGDMEMRIQRGRGRPRKDTAVTHAALDESGVSGEQEGGAVDLPEGFNRRVAEVFTETEAEDPV